ncbi:MAG: AAA family ATPase [Candidatus Ventricola sp.]
MGNKIITIGRQYGSGGREIGEKLAKKLGYAFYDTLLLEKTAGHSCISQSILERYDERLADKWLNTALNSGTMGIDQLPIPIRAAVSQFETILKIGQTESAVIVGRCADYVLREQNNVLSVFIHAEMEHRVSRVTARNKVCEAEAKKLIQNTDRHRAAYYEYYTDKRWGDSQSYHLCIDSGLFGIDGAVTVLQNCLQSIPK